MNDKAFLHLTTIFITQTVSNGFLQALSFWQWRPNTSDTEDLWLEHLMGTLDALNS